MPFEIEVHTVPHFKAPVNCKKGWEGLEDVRIFMQENRIVYLGLLVHKMGFVETAIVCTVDSLNVYSLHFGVYCFPS